MNSKEFKPKGLATAIGSLPYTDPVEACTVALKYLPDVPVWPQLPQRSFLENMYAQYSEGLPGVVLEDNSIYIDRTADLTAQIEKLYAAYLENDLDSAAISREYAPGFYEFISRDIGSPLAVKGQITGPISFGLTVTDKDRRPTLYDETLADAMARHLRLKAAWMERELSKLSPTTILFVDEPYLTSLGSAFVALDNQTVIDLTNEALGGLKGLSGMHCCGNTDWSVLMATNIDILNFDAYVHGESLALYPDDLKSFLDRGGVLAWGIVPSEEELMADVTVSKMMERLKELIALLVGKSINQDALLEQSLMTPSCGMGTVSTHAAEKALRLTSEVSAEFRSTYSLEGK